MIRSQPLNVDLQDITAMVTVMRVTKDTVIGWDGLSSEESKTVFIPIAEFTAPDMRVTDPWTHYKSLSLRVARIFWCVGGGGAAVSSVVSLSHHLVLEQRRSSASTKKGAAAA